MRSVLCSLENRNTATYLKFVLSDRFSSKYIVHGRNQTVRGGGEFGVANRSHSVFTLRKKFKSLQMYITYYSRSFVRFEIAPLQYIYIYIYIFVYYYFVTILRTIVMYAVRVCAAEKNVSEKPYENENVCFIVNVPRGLPATLPCLSGYPTKKSRTSSAEFVVYTYGKRY